MSRPNILYIHSHDTGRYIQPYGRGVATPSLQRLAEEGVFFRQAFSAAPVCSASRSALLTGQMPHSNGMMGLAHRGFHLNDYSQHLASFLGKAGYHTALAGEQHEIPDHPERLGYQEILPVNPKGADGVASAAEAFLSRPIQGPFFLSVGFHETHREFPNLSPSPSPEGRGEHTFPSSPSRPSGEGPGERFNFVLPPAPLPDLPVVRQDMAGFVASARALDAGVGRVLAALETSGLAANTLVIATTDHGIAFPGMKCTLTDHGLGVYLILRGPGPFQPGRVVDAMVSHLDLYPTLCELLDLPAPAYLQGCSLIPLLRGQVDKLHSELFGEVTYHAAYEPMRSVRTSRWKYIRRFDYRTRPVLPNCDDSPSKTALLGLGWGEREIVAEQLYDLVLDPNEANNLALLPQSAGTLVEMRARLENWMRSTNDPLLTDPAQFTPRDAVANDPDGLSPSEPPRRVFPF
jgi:arylsulfatase A-like enzyme